MNADPTQSTVIKSLSIKKDGAEFFIILRGQYGINGVVQFKRLLDLSSLGAVVLSMIADGKWGPDKYS